MVHACVYACVTVEGRHKRLNCQAPVQGVLHTSSLPTLSTHSCTHQCHPEQNTNTTHHTHLVLTNASASLASVDTAEMSSSTAAALVLMGLWGWGAAEGACVCDTGEREGIEGAAQKQGRSWESKLGIGGLSTRCLCRVRYSLAASKRLSVLQQHHSPLLHPTRTWPSLSRLCSAVRWITRCALAYCSRARLA